jgi:glycosyltransferase involved in cell wall biosynthesis
VRIAHIVIGGDVAGGQMVALELARAARDVGHDVCFISPSEGPFLDIVRGDGMAAHVVPISGALDVGALIAVSRTLWRDRVELVHTHGHFSVNVVARLAARITRARIVSHMHIENSFRQGPSRRAQVVLDNATARLCSSIVTVSEATRESLVRQGYPVDRLITVHNGIDASPAQPVRLAENVTILEVARLAEVKGQRLLLAALPHLNATLVLVGRDIEHNGAYERALKEEADRLGVADRVVFAGYRQDVPALLAGCDVFCLPSEMEGLPLVVLEAMAQGRPVVATAVGGTPELVLDGETGLLVPPRDVDALRAALARVLGDPDLARRLGDAGLDRVLSQFSAHEMHERILRIYEDAT